MTITDISRITEAKAPESVERCYQANVELFIGQISILYGDT
jgi:hypothetical protein